MDKKIKILRGIICHDINNQFKVYSPGHIHYLNHKRYHEESLKEGQKVLGVIIHNQFNICREFISNAGEFVFGYVIRKDDPGKQLLIQTIPGFEPNTFNPYETDYNIGEEAIVEIN